jgi:hypothetical protein
MLALSIGSGVYEQEDSYLSAISQEAKKVDVGNQPTLSESGEPAGQTEDGLSLQAFEEDLTTRHKGSYTLLSKTAAQKSGRGFSGIPRRGLYRRNTPDNHAAVSA